MNPTEPNNPTLPHDSPSPVDSSEAAWEAGLAAAFGGDTTRGTFPA